MFAYFIMDQFYGISAGKLDRSFRFYLGKLRTQVYLMFRYRTYRRPRYKVAYKMVTEMEWKCCHGYSGEDCHDGPKAPTNTQVNGGRPHGTNGNGGVQGSQGGKNRQKRPHVKTFLYYVFLFCAQAMLRR